MEICYILMIVAFQALSVRSQDVCDVGAIQQCTSEYASKISSLELPTVEVICGAYRGFQSCLEPHNEPCADNPVFRQFAAAQASISQQCGARNTNGEVDCDVEALTLCTTQYANGVQGAQTRAHTCRLISDLKDCIKPFDTACQNIESYQIIKNTLNSTRDACGDGSTSQSRCDNQALEACMNQYVTSVSTANTRLETCRLISDLKDCIKPFDTACQNIESYQIIKNTLNSTRDVCGDGSTSQSRCDNQALEACMNQYVTSVSTANTRLETCSLVSTLKDCVRPLGDTCRDQDIFQSITDSLDSTRDICDDGSTGRSRCDIQALEACKNQYLTSVSTANTRLETCRLVSTLKDCVRPLGDTCRDQEIFQSITDSLDATRDVCDDVSTGRSRCDIQALEACKTQYLTSVNTANTRLETCRLVSTLKDCVRPLGDTCRDQEIFQSITDSLDATRDVCDDGSTGRSRCDIQALDACKNQYLTSVMTANTRLETCRIVSTLKDCVRPLGDTCRDQEIFQSISDSLDATRDVCDDGSSSRSRCDNQALKVCMNQYRTSTSSANTRLETCRALTVLEDCLQPHARTCKRHIVFKRFRDISESIEDTCAEDEFDVTCRDWNNTVIRDGEIFSPKRHESCYRCVCDNGRLVACKDTACIPPTCEGAVPVEGVCCEFVCPIEESTPSTRSEVDECPEGWIPYGSKCYFISRDRLNWIDSQMMCKMVGGKLVEIASADENSFVKNLTSSSGVTNFWIGVTDLEVAGAYKFPATNTAINFSDWARRVPPVVKALNCVEIKKARLFNWRPTRCTKRINFVCERHLHDMD